MCGLRFFAAVVVTTAGAASALAGTLRVPGDFDTVQAAVDAASPGDTIVVRGGVWTEFVEIAGKSDLTLVGRGAPVLEGGGVRSNLNIRDSAGVRVRGFRLRNASDFAVRSENSTDVVLSRCTISSPGGDGVSLLTSDRAVVARCRISGAGSDGVDAEPLDGGRFEGNLVTGCAVRGIYVADGTGNVVTRNRVRSCGYRGIDVRRGTAARVSFNTVTDVGDAAIYVGASGSTVDRNTTAHSSDDGIAITGDGIVVTRCRIRKAQDDGIDVDNCTNCRIERCTITDVAEHGLQVYGSTGNLFLRVTIRRSGDPSVYDESPQGANEYRRCRYSTVHFGP